MHINEFMFLFPANKRGQATTMEGQLYYIEDELKELEAEYMGTGESIETVMEAFDVLCATESFLRKCDPELVKKGFSRTLAKGRERGDWE